MIEIPDTQKIKDITRILQSAKRNNEMTYETLERIKRVIFPNANLKR